MRCAAQSAGGSATAVNWHPALRVALQTTPGRARPAAALAPQPTPFIDPAPFELCAAHAHRGRGGSGMTETVKATSATRPRRGLTRSICRPWLSVVHGAGQSIGAAAAIVGGAGSQAL